MTKGNPGPAIQAKFARAIRIVSDLHGPQTHTHRDELQAVHIYHASNLCLDINDEPSNNVIKQKQTQSDINMMHTN